MAWDIIDNGIRDVQTKQANANPTDGFDKNRDLEIGGEAGGYKQDAARFKEASEQAAKSTAPVANWTGGNKYGALADSSRAGTQDALSLMRDRANGIHTAADATADKGNAMATATNAAILRGGRGAGAMAGAGQQAAGVASRLATDNRNNKAINNAADTAQAQQQLAQGYGQQRNQDASQQHVLDTRSQYDTDLAMRNQGQNDAQQMGWEKLRYGANASGLAGEEAVEDANFNDWAQRSNLHETVAGMDQAQAMKYAGAAANGLGQGIGYAANQDPGYDYSDPNAGTPNSRGNDDNGFSSNNPYGTSDERAKENIKEEGAFAKFRKKFTHVVTTQEGSREFSRSLLPEGVQAAGDRLKQRAIDSGAEKSFQDAHQKAANVVGNFAAGTGEKFVDDTRGWGNGGDGSNAGYVERVSKAMLNTMKRARHASGADQYDPPGNPDIDVGEVDNKVHGTHGAVHAVTARGSVKDFQKAFADKEARESQQQVDELDSSPAAKYAREVLAYKSIHNGRDTAPGLAGSDRAEVGSESGPMTDVYGRPHEIVQKYGENFYPGFKEADPTRMEPPKGGDIFRDGKMQKAPGPVNPYEQKRLEYEAFVKAHQEPAEPAVALPPPAPPTASMAMLDQVKPVSFDYKPGYGAPGRNYGVLAQDLEKSPMGASLVSKDPQGIRKVNIGKATMANMASTADLHERVKVLEGGVDKSAEKRERQEHIETPEPLPPPAPPPPEDGVIASDEVVKDDIRREGIDPQTAFLSRHNELTAAAEQGHPEAPRKLEHLEREGSVMGLGGSQAPAGNLLGADVSQEPNMSQNFGPLAPPPEVPEPVQSRGGASGTGGHDPVGAATKYAQDVVKGVKSIPEGARQAGALVTPAASTDPRPTVAAQYATKVKDFVTKHAAAAAGLEKSPEGKYRVGLGKDKPAEPFERVAESTGRADEDTTTKGEVPAPKAASGSFDTIAEREMGPAPQGGPSSTTIAAHYEDQIGPEAWGALSQAQRDAYVAADNISNRGFAQAHEDYGVASEHAKQAAARGVLAMHDQRQAELHGRDLDTLGRELEADAHHLANYHENPNQFWESRSTGQRVSAIIAIMLGGFAQGLRGGSNAALDQMNRAQDKDIDAQRANYQANKDSVAVKRSSYGMAMERYNHDDNKATAALRLAGLDKMEAEGKMLAAKHAGTDTADRLDKFLADTSQLKADQIIKYKKYIQTQTVQHGLSMDAVEKLWQKYYAEVRGRGEDPGERADFIHGLMGGRTRASGWGASADRKAAAHEKQVESDRKMTVVVDGIPRLATNDGVVKDWNDYSHVAAEARRLYKVLQATRAGGAEDTLANQAAYHKASAEFKELAPALFGFARGPSVAQVKHTLGDEFIPPYVHIYDPSKIRSRADVALDDLGKTLDTIDKSMREHTLGQSAAPTIAPQEGSGGNATPSTFKEAK